MERSQLERRNFLQLFGALGAAAAFPTAALAKPYDPAAKFDLTVSDVPFRRNAEYTVSFHQLAWRNSTTFRRAGSSWLRIAVSRAFV